MNLGSLFLFLGVGVILFALLELAGLTTDMKTLFIALLFLGLGWLLGWVPFPGRS